MAQVQPDKVAVFDILKRSDSVYTQVMLGTKTDILISIWSDSTESIYLLLAGSLMLQMFPNLNIKELTTVSYLPTNATMQVV